MGFEIGLGQDTVDRAPAHVAVTGLLENLESEIVQGPGSVGLLMLFGLTTGQRDDVQTFGGGKSSGGDRSEERLGGRPGRG